MIDVMFRSGTNGLNEELGRHRGKNDNRQYKLCGEECVSVEHVALGVSCV